MGVIPRRAAPESILRFPAYDLKETVLIFKKHEPRIYHIDMRIPVFGEVIFSQNVIEFSLDVLLFLKERGIMFITGKK